MFKKNNNKNKYNKNKKNNKNNKNKLSKKLKNKKKLCPCKEKFENEPKPASPSPPASTESPSTFTKFDDGLGSMFGNSKLVISNKDYNLRDYRWLILILILAFIILAIKAFV